MDLLNNKDAELEQLRAQLEAVRKDRLEGYNRLRDVAIYRDQTETRLLELQTKHECLLAAVQPVLQWYECRTLSKTANELFEALYKAVAGVPNTAELWAEIKDLVEHADSRCMPDSMQVLAQRVRELMKKVGV